MKIVIICDVLGKKNNGTTIAAYNLINHLIERGHDVNVISPDKTKNGKEGYYIVPTLNLGKFLNGILKKNGVTLAKCDDELLKRVIKGADAVHLLVPLILSRKALQIARSENIPITASFHCQAENITAHVGLMNAKRVNNLIYRNFEKHVYQYCDVIHYPTKFIKNVFEREGRTSTPGVVISNGVNNLFYTQSESLRDSEKFTIICTGRYSKEKDQGTLIKAVSLSRHKDDIKIILAGCGPKQRKLENMIKKYNVDCTMSFFSREELAKRLRGADLYVHTAIIEIEAISCAEAIISGLVPIICNSERSATTSFALDERNLFKERDAVDLAEKIDYFYEHPQMIVEYKERYKKFRDVFSQEKCMEKMEEMIINAVSSKKENKICV